MTTTGDENIGLISMIWQIVFGFKGEEKEKGAGGGDRRTGEGLGEGGLSR